MLFEILLEEKEISKIYGNNNLEKLLRKNEYFTKAVRMFDNNLAMILIYNTTIEPGDGEYLGIYDGKKLKRVYLYISNEPINLHEITSRLYYDNISGKRYDSDKVYKALLLRVSLCKHFYWQLSGIA